MCGIYGAVFGEQAQPPVLAPVIAALESRGPDGYGTWYGPGAAFAHRRLRILDLAEAADQPMVAADGACVVVFSGEIYNYVELRTELLALGHTFSTTSDTEVLLCGYLAYGERVIERLVGMFAFGIWDTRSRVLLLARDRAGKKPLFYAENTSHGFQFASTLGALTAAGVDASVDEESIPSLLAFGFPHAPRTMLRGVKQLPPRHLLRFAPGGTVQVSEYAPPPMLRRNHPYTESQAITTLRKLVRDAVERRVHADVAVGASLSGGLDSSIVVAEMAALSPRPVQTFSIAFDAASGCDESHYARNVAAHFKTEHQELRVDADGIGIPQLCVDVSDGPFGDSSLWPTSLVCKLARERVKVLLSGDGGDELFAGYTRFGIVEATERVPRQLFSLLAKIVGGVAGVRPGQGTLARVGKILRRESLPLADRILAWQTYFGFELEELLAPGFLTTAEREEPLRIGRQILVGAEEYSIQSQLLHYNFETYLPNDLLVKGDRASMAHGVELRSPFLDQALVAFSASLPDHFRRRGITTKWLLRRAYMDVLPKQILQRPKQGFAAPVGPWVRGTGAVTVKHHFRPDAPVFRYLHRPFVVRILDEHDSGRADHVHRIWLLLTLAVWLEQVMGAKRDERRDSGATGDAAVHNPAQEHNGRRHQQSN
jgi:asparagine synthase (glutamine-hydrolysing)